MSQNFARKKSTDKHRKMRDLQILLEREFGRKKVNVEKITDLENELHALETVICNGAILRSKSQWAMEGERSTKFFLTLERQRQENNVIKCLFDKGNNTVTDPYLIMQRIHEFYSDLYKYSDINHDALNNILNNLSKVSENEKKMCDDSIKTDEIKTALFAMKTGKSPGKDGLTAEFYRTFYDIFQPLFIRLFNQIEQNNIMPRSMRRGVISLFYKNKGDKRDIANFRPISLLNVDYKILAKIMANRLKHVLPFIINPNQTCCVPGRDISDNVFNIRDVIDYVEYTQSQGFLIKFDQRKAFDLVSHKYLFETLRRFGFGDKFVNWISILYTDISSCVKSNGHLTSYFPVQRSVRQGCPVSAMLYVICVEPLARLFLTDSSIQPILISNVNSSLIYQHADDTTITIRNESSVFNSLELFDVYSKASGGEINYNKTQIMALGTSVVSQQIARKLTVQDDHIEILGVCVGKNKLICEQKNWDNKCLGIRRI